jgi:hypothetical protein
MAKRPPPRDLRALAEANRPRAGAPPRWDALAAHLTAEELAQVEQLLADPSMPVAAIRQALIAVGFPVSESTVRDWARGRRR